jgi:hypothetical protein
MLSSVYYMDVRRENDISKDDSSYRLNFDRGKMNKIILWRELLVV